MQLTQRGRKQRGRSGLNEEGGLSLGGGKEGTARRGAHLQGEPLGFTGFLREGEEGLNHNCKWEDDLTKES